VGFALAALHEALGRALPALDLLGGRAPASVGAANDPSEWWPEDGPGAAEALDRVRAMVLAHGEEPMVDDGNTLTFLTSRGLLIDVSASSDGAFIEFAARVTEDIDLIVQRCLKPWRSIVGWSSAD
jgi:hypothetical protein